MKYRKHEITGSSVLLPEFPFPPQVNKCLTSFAYNTNTIDAGNNNDTDNNEMKTAIAQLGLSAVLTRSYCCREICVLIRSWDISTETTVGT